MAFDEPRQPNAPARMPGLNAHLCDGLRTMPCSPLSRPGLPENEPVEIGRGFGVDEGLDPPRGEDSTTPTTALLTTKVKGAIASAF